MRWDAWLDDGKGEFTFGRPIRWMLFLFGGRVVPFVDPPQPGRAIEPGAGRPHRCPDLRPSVPRDERAARAGRSRCAASVTTSSASASTSSCSSTRSATTGSCANSMRMPAGSAAASHRSRRCCTRSPTSWSTRRWSRASFPPEFLALPDEVLTTTMIHHQHYFPVLDDQPKLLPAFLAVTNIEVEQPQKIAINAERVLDGTPARCAVLLGRRSSHAARSQARAPRHAAVPQGPRQLRRQGAAPRAAGPMDRHRGLWRHGRRRPSRPAPLDVSPRPI